MAKFTDNQNRTWIVAVNIPLARRIRDQLEFDLLDLEKALARLAVDPILLCDTLWILCAEQAAKNQVTDEQFGQSLIGEAIEAAGDALVDALLDFSPPRQKALLTNLRTISETYQSALAGTVSRATETLNSTLGSSSANSPGSSDSNQPELSET